MKFHFQLASLHNIPEIMKLMDYARRTVTPKEWFVDDTQEYMEYLIKKDGFIVLAYPENKSSLAGFFAIKFPGNTESNLGHHLNFQKEQLLQCAHMDSAVVYSDYRGNHLQSQMAAVAENLLQQLPYRYLFATIHPDNKFSLNNMISCGYEIITTTKLYGGLQRVVVYKEL